jgi:hypothetical protein
LDRVAFTRFNYFLRTRLDQIGRADSGRELSDLVDEIEDGVAQLRIEAEKLAKGRLRAAKISFFGLALASTATNDNSALHVAAGVLGSATLYDLLKDYAERHRSEADLKKSPHYIPYLFLRDEPHI